MSGQNAGEMPFSGSRNKDSVSEVVTTEVVTTEVVTTDACHSFRARQAAIFRKLKGVFVPLLRDSLEDGSAQ
jgi:hypothetical protein